MRVRRLTKKPKVMVSSTPWTAGDIPPKHAPIYPKTKPLRGTWRWRSAKAVADEVEFVLIAECDPPRDNWKAALIQKVAGGYSVIGRFEDHGSHKGLHVHAHCDRGGVEIGATGMGGLARIPPAGRHHRRVTTWTEATFWDAAKAHFRIVDDFGPLFNYDA